MAERTDTTEATLRGQLERCQSERDALSLAAKEAEHRSRNLVALAGSILHMQRAGVTDPRARDALAAAERRLIALSMMHDHLRTGADGPRVGLRAYLDRFVDAIGLGDRAARPAISIEVTMGDEEWPLEVARPFLILVTEAVTNAFLHGLAAEGGRITVALTRPDASNLRLVVDNDGRRLPDEIATGFGLRLIGLMAEQLGGRFSLVPGTDAGSVLQVDFPVPAAT